MNLHKQCAAVLITNEKDELLLIKQAYGKRCYGFPGGLVEPLETPPIAASREVYEEISIKVKIDYLIGSYLLKGGGLPGMFASVYKGHIIGGALSIKNKSEIEDVFWCDSSNLPAPLLPDAEAALEDYLNKRQGVVRDHQRKIRFD